MKPCTSPAHAIFLLVGLFVACSGERAAPRAPADSAPKSSSLTQPPDEKPLVPHVEPAPARIANAITGRVEWAGGKPAAGAVLTWTSIAPEAMFDFDVLGTRKIVSGADGSFSIQNLKDGPIRIEASAHPNGSSAVWTAAMDSVEVGATSVVLALKAGLEIKGRVVDDLGAPVKSFRIKALRSTPVVGNGTSMSGPPIRKFDDPSGQFVLTDVPEGSWEVHAEGPGSSLSLPGHVALPGTDAPLELRIPRRASITGRVVDPDGKDVKGATIRMPQKSDGSRALFSTNERVVTTRALGAFTIDDIVPGSIVLQASGERWAVSEERTFTLKPGEKLQDIVLALRVGGTIAGEVLDALGNPDAGRALVAIDEQDLYSSHVITDAKGHFEIPDLATGSYRVVLNDNESLRAEQQPNNRVAVDVVAGQTSHVVVGGKIELPIHVRGLVHLGNSPVAGIGVSLTKTYNNPSFASTDVTSDAEGRIDFGLPLPGTHWCELTVGSTQQLCRRIIPDQPEVVLDFTVGSGRIAGRVIGHDGQPLVRTSVTLGVDRESTERTAYDTHGSVETDAQGRFAFDHLSPATYRVQVGEARGSDTSLPQLHGQAQREGLAIRSDETLDVEFALTKSCVLSGIVRGPDGAPTPAVQIFARDENGALFDDQCLARTDGEGRFRIGGLPAGRASFFARTESLSSIESALVALDPQQAPNIELNVRRATRVWVEVKSASNGKISRCQVRIYDSSGRDTNVASWKSAPEDDAPGSLEAVLPPGTYRVLARHEDGSSATATIELGGEPFKSVELRLSR